MRTGLLSLKWETQEEGEEGRQSSVGAPRWRCSGGMSRAEARGHPGEARRETWLGEGRAVAQQALLLHQPLGSSFLPLCRPGVCVLRGPAFHAGRHDGHLLLPVWGGLAVRLQPGGTAVTAGGLAALPGGFW